MSSVNTDGLPPEMQARIAQIIEGAKKKVTEQAAPQAPAPVEAPVPTPPEPETAPEPPKPPSLMDHTVALRNEVAYLTQQVNAVGQVTDAVGQAVAQLYEMFRQQTTASDQSATYSEGFQEQVTEDDY